MAQWHAKGLLKPGEDFVHESIIGSIFRGRIESVTTCGSFPAIVPSVEGWARITGYNTIIIDDEDPYAHGFSVV
jgi:4-hydroxyproline epimerase